MRIYSTSTERAPAAAAATGSDACTWCTEDTTANRDGHLQEAICRDSEDPHERLELLNTSSSSSSFTTSATMGDSRQPPSIEGSKTDLCPERITFREDRLWKRCTSMEKCLIFFVILLFLVAAAAIAVALYLHLAGEKDVVEEEVCTTQDCLETAAYISKSMDTTVNPCDDFYQFACGRWMKDNPIPPSLPAINHFVVINKKMQETMRDLLSEDDPEALDGVIKARTFFKSCEDTDAMDGKGTGPLLDLLKTGGSNLFPTLEPDWVDEGLNLTQLLTRIGKVGNLGSSPVVTFAVHARLKHSYKNSIYFTQTGFFLPSRKYYMLHRNDSVLKKYEQLYVDVMTSLGADVTTARRDAVELVDFEILVANATEPKELRRNVEALHNKMTVRNLTDRYPKLDWLGHLQRQFAPVDINITMEEEVIVDGLKYYDRIFPVIDNVSRRTLMNYCMWRLVYPLVGLLDKRLRDIKKDFSEKLYGIARSTERWQECVTATQGNFPDAFGRLFIDKQFSHHAKERVESMIHDLTASFNEMVHEADWMSDKTKRAALEKIEAMLYKIGYSAEIVNDTALNQKTEKFNMTADGYFHNHLNMYLHSRIKKLKKLRQPVERDEWPVSAATINAFNNIQTNQIVFPAGILARPFFSDQYPDALNYGGIGFVIGHEITHSVDDRGSSFDKDGNLHRWWQLDDLKRFRERLQCMVHQYSNYTEPVLGVNLNGKLTIGENVADNGGLKEAFRAYRKLIAKRGKEEPKLPVINYTPDQLFFIGAAQAWCGNTRPKARKAELWSNVHSPLRFRVIGPFQNNANFSRAFNCPVGSYMNPAKKCHLW